MDEIPDTECFLLILKTTSFSWCVHLKTTSYYEYHPAVRRGDIH